MEMSLGIMDILYKGQSWLICNWPLYPSFTIHTYSYLLNGALFFVNGSYSFYVFLKYLSFSRSIRSGRIPSNRSTAVSRLSQSVFPADRARPIRRTGAALPTNQRHRGRYSVRHPVTRAGSGSIPNSGDHVIRQRWSRGHSHPTVCYVAIIPTLI